MRNRWKVNWDAAGIAAGAYFFLMMLAACIVRVGSRPDRENAPHPWSALEMALFVLWLAPFLIAGVVAGIWWLRQGNRILARERVPVTEDLRKARR